MEVEALEVLENATSFVDIYGLYLIHLFQNQFGNSRFQSRLKLFSWDCKNLGYK